MHVADVASRYTFSYHVQDWVPSDKKKEGFAEHRPHGVNNIELMKSFCDTLTRLSPLPHVFVTDSGFTSIKVARAVRAKGCDLVGAVKAQFSGIKKDVLLRKSTVTPHGASVFARHRDGDLLLQSWNDRGPVNILSTYHKGVVGSNDPASYSVSVESVTRRRKDHDTGTWKEVIVPVPPAVRMYQRYMKGVDHSDQVRVHICTLRVLCNVSLCVGLCLLPAAPHGIRHKQGVQAVVYVLVLLLP